MGTLIKISKSSKPQNIRKELDKLAKAREKEPRKTLADFYGKMPNVYGDGLAYQKKIRNEWP